jgi:pilus assembly protein CpaF
LEALGMTAGLPQAAVHSLMASAVDVVVHLHRGADGRRRVAELAVLDREPSGLVTARPAVTFDGDGRMREQPGAEALRRALAG